METGKLIKELRLKKGMTQDELANKTEVSSRTIQRIENGEVVPRSHSLQVIARALDVDFSMFVELETEKIQPGRMKDNNNYLGLLHLSAIIPLIFPTILIWNLKKDMINNLSEHYRIVMSFQLMILGVALGCLWVYWWTGQLIPLIGVLLMNALFSILNTLKVMSGEPYLKMPFIKK